MCLRLLQADLVVRDLEAVSVVSYTDTLLSSTVGPGTLRKLADGTQTPSSAFSTRADDAAALLQACFRGYYTRRRLELFKYAAWVRDRPLVYVCCPVAGIACRWRDNGPLAPFLRGFFDCIYNHIGS